MTVFKRRSNIYSDSIFSLFFDCLYSAFGIISETCKATVLERNLFSFHRRRLSLFYDRFTVRVKSDFSRIVRDCSDESSHGNALTRILFVQMKLRLILLTHR